jgi:hypothetical protein
MGGPAYTQLRDRLLEAATRVIAAPSGEYTLGFYHGLIRAVALIDDTTEDEIHRLVQDALTEAIAAGAPKVDRRPVARALRGVPATGPWGSDAAIVMKDEGADDQGRTIGPAWHRSTDGTERSLREGWMTADEAEKLAKEIGLPFYTV